MTGAAVKEPKERKKAGASEFSEAPASASFGTAGAGLALALLLPEVLQGHLGGLDDKGGEGDLGSPDGLFHLLNDIVGKAYILLCGLGDCGELEFSGGSITTLHNLYFTLCSEMCIIYA